MSHERPTTYEDTAYFRREYFELHPGKQRYLDYLIRTLRDHGVSSGRVLDIGSGYGFLLQALESAGYEPHGVEVSPHAAEHSRRRSAAPVSVQRAERPLPYPDETFTAITMLDVIEHLGDYRTTLDECHRTLLPGGVLLVVTLNARSLLRLLLGRRWSWYQDATHEWMFSAGMLSTALREAGLAVVRLSTIFNLHVAGETTRFLRPLRRLATVVRVPWIGDSLLVIAERPDGRGSPPAESRNGR